MAGNYVYVSATRLTFAKLKVIFQWKFDKYPPEGTNKKKWIAAWIDSNHKQPDNKPANWSGGDELEIVRI